MDQLKGKTSAVLCAFHEASGLSEAEAQREAAPFASGRAGKCEAVLPAKYVLKQVYGNSVDIKIAEFEEKFVSRETTLLVILPTRKFRDFYRVCHQETRSQF